MIRIGIALLLLLTGCREDASREPVQANPETRPASIETLTGFISFGNEFRTFRPCESDAVYRISDLTRSLDSLRTEFAPKTDSFEAVFAVVDGRFGEVTPDGFTADYDGILEILFVDYVRHEGFGCQYEWRAFDFRAFGNEPSWSVDLTEGIAILQQPGVQTLHWENIDVRDEDGAMRFLSGDSSLEAVLMIEPCRDTMSGTYFGYTAIVMLDDRELRGCAFHGIEPNL